MYLATENYTVEGGQNAYNGVGFKATITPNSSLYSLPDVVEIKVSGNTLSSGYTYNSKTGEVIIQSNVIDGPISIFWQEKKSKVTVTVNMTCSKYSSSWVFDLDLTQDTPITITGTNYKSPSDLGCVDQYPGLAIVEGATLTSCEGISANDVELRGHNAEPTSYLDVTFKSFSSITGNIILGVKLDYAPVPI